ncbi:hypothetical protein [Actinoplanes sp. HUAS TT8]|uniref:hypothetical protein n=1 Tax=Actinoplanes sp. HUAS TT8 TaxID=3447453 RepID=UPI003F528EE3
MRTVLGFVVLIAVVLLGVALAADVKNLATRHVRRSAGLVGPASRLLRPGDTEEKRERRLARIVLLERSFGAVLALSGCCMIVVAALNGGWSAR